MAGLCDRRSIPYELSRLKTFQLRTMISPVRFPSNLSKFQAEDFDGNNGLHGKPLGSKYGGLSSKGLAIIIAAGGLGAALGFAF